MNTQDPEDVPHQNTFHVRQLAGTQAARVFGRFGGVPSLYKALAQAGEDAKRTLSTLYRWNLPKKNGGSNGVIPTSAWPDIMKAARLEGVHLTPEDCMPGEARK